MAYGACGLGAWQLPASCAEAGLFTRFCALHAYRSAESDLKTTGALLVHEDKVIVIDSINLLYHLLGQKCQSVAQGTFIIENMVQLFLARLVHKFTHLVMFVKLSFTLRNLLASSLCKRTIEGEIHAWQRFYLENLGAAVGTWPLFVSCPRDAFQAKGFMAWALASHNVRRDIIANGALQLLCHFFVSDEGLSFKHQKYQSKRIISSLESQHNRI